MLRGAALLAVAFAALTTPAHAAGTAAISGTAIVVELDGADDTVNLGMSGSAVIVQDAGITPQAPCVVSPYGASCPATGMTGIRVHGAGGNDTLSAVPALVPFGQPALAGVSLPVAMTGDAGDDTLIGGGRADILDGGDGNDALFGGAGIDTLTGGAGDDLLQGDADADILDGGQGSDTASWAPSADPVAVTLDGQANDGATGENDGANVENIIGGHGDDHLTGNAESNGISGGDGNDTIDGGAGADALYGDAGFDTILAQDGAVDRIDCGSDNDGATRDDFDSVLNCETDTHSATRQPTFAPPSVPGPAVSPSAITPIPPPLQTFDTALVGAYALGSRGTKVKSLKLTHLQAGATVTATCTKGAKACPFSKPKTFTASPGTVDLRKALKLNTVKPGVTLAISLAGPGRVTRTTTLAFAKNKAPRLSVTCTLPSGNARTACI
jgi:Ca2+-binding RTX toxin-like protein